MAKAQFEQKLASTEGGRIEGSTLWSCCQPLATTCPGGCHTAPPSTGGRSSFQHFIVTDSARSLPRAAGTGTDPAQQRAQGP